MATTRDGSEASRPDALTPAETLEKAEALGVSKAGMAADRCFVSAMLAGAFIGFGATYFLVVSGDPSLPFAAQRAMGGVCFCLGLVLVLCCGAELFTGNNLMVTSLLSKRIKMGGLLRNWAIVWAGNLAGSLLAVALVFAAGVADMNGGAVGDAMVSVAVGKVAPGWGTLFSKAVMCNMAVCLAVWIGYSARTVADKVLGILLPISFFVAAGFEHCVANMFFLPMGLLAKALGCGSAVAGVEALGAGSALCNLSAVTLGNVVGGLLVGAAYWFVYRRKAASG
ncbi:formate transporter FocA [Gordonibacter sp. An230]|uniref:formate/nitrite transporter family protein n=1 Tax=Gordonibacter sp. An230 TaxID=1965592 RepID=UPI000B39A030|nr:formate/nitrite transporter family protein [Gordonibacter sp. An230]OUO88899.1 formate transporter FocA [Gordonibacter sp. An230]